MTEHASSERRQRTLTKHDLADLAKLMDAKNICSLNINPEVAKAINELTPEQWGILRRIMIISGKAANVTGVVIITAAVGGLIAIFTKGFWATLIFGVTKKGVGQ